MEMLWRRLPLLPEHLWGGVCPAKPPKETRVSKKRCPGWHHPQQRPGGSGLSAG